MTQPGPPPYAPVVRLGPTGLADEIADLLLRPGHFFRALPDRRLARLWILFAILVGCAAAADRIDQRLLLADLFPGRRGAAVGAVASSWAAYWGAVAMAGLVGAVPLYWIAGWWLGIRARWSGASLVDWRLVRRIEVFSTAVAAVPRLAWTGIETLWFPDYRAAYDSDEFLGLYVFGMLVWSVFVSYRGITATHAVRRGRAIFWLVALPLGFYAVIFGGAMAYIAWPQQISP